MRKISELGEGLFLIQTDVEFSELLTEPLFSKAALIVFRKLGYSYHEDPISQSNNPLGFVYNELPKELIITSEEKETLKDIVEISHLFDTDDFEENAPVSKVSFYSIDIREGAYQRSKILCDTHKIITRKLGRDSIVIARQGSSFSLSFALSNVSGKELIYLADWYNSYSIELEEAIGNLHCGNYTITSAREFLIDVIYQMARRYYIYPLSYEYIRYEIFPQSIWFGNDQDNEIIKEFIEKEYYAHIIEYGDDYIEESDAWQLDLGTESEYNFDDIEYELELLGAFDNNYEFYDSDIDEEYADYESSVDLSQIPPEILSNPVELIKWFEKADLIDESSDSADEPAGKGYNAEITQLLEDNEIDYIDNRDKGGALWALGGIELSEILQEFKLQTRVEFNFKDGGGRSIVGFDAWWTKQ